MKLLRSSLRNTTVPALWILVLMVSLGPFGDTEYTPSLPRIAHELGVSYGAVQQSMTVYLLGYAMVQLFYGPWSDRIGRKPVALWGALLFTLGSYVCWISNSLGMLLAGRFLQGLGACAGAVISSAAVRDSYPKEQLEVIYLRINAAFAVAPAIGPVVGSLVDDRFGWQANMLILLILGSLLLAVVLLFLPETHWPDPSQRLLPGRLWHTYGNLFRHRTYLPAILINGLAIGVVYSSLTEAPALVTEVLGLRSRWIAVVAGGVLLAFVGGSLLGVQLLKRISPAPILRIGLLLIVAGAVLQAGMGYWGWVNLPSMLLPIMVSFSGIALIVPNATGIAMRPFSRVAGAAAAMLGFSQMGIAALANVGVSLLPLSPVYALPVIFMIIGLLGIAVYWHGPLYELRLERETE